MPTEYETVVRAAESAAVATWEGGEGLSPPNRLRAALDEYRGILEGAGMLPRPDFYRGQDIERAAKALAFLSDHPRYLHGRWTVLRENLREVEVAAAAADRHIAATGNSATMRRALDNCRTLLEDYIRSRQDTS